jgi:RNA polymerase sigma-70 factor (ECF subfamily)
MRFARGLTMPLYSSGPTPAQTTQHDWRNSQSGSHSFAALIGRLKAGDADAAAVIYERYARRLIALAQGKLASRLRAKVDPEDVVQTVFGTFFHRIAQREFDLAGEDALWALLATITARECGRCRDHFFARKRGGEQRETPIEGALDEQVVDRHQVSPEKAVMLLELTEELLRGLDQRQRMICELRLQGHSVAEVAQQVGCAIRVVYRDLDFIKRRCHRLALAQAG